MLTLMPSFRLILDPPRTATFNMAVDEFLLSQAVNSGNTPVLRIYSWKSPAYTIGYFQKFDEIAKIIRHKQKNVTIVRRLTGWGLVSHGEDVTFSLVTRYPNSYFSNDTKSSYLKINEALMAGFRKLYPGLDFADCKTVPSQRAKAVRICFESPACYDLMLDRRKVVGASQRRSRGILLHQSTVFLPGGPALLTGKILEGFREKWKIDFEEIPLSEEEVEGALKIEKERYSQAQWAIGS